MKQQIREGKLLFVATATHNYPNDHQTLFP